MLLLLYQILVQKLCVNDDARLFFCGEVLPEVRSHEPGSKALFRSHESAEAVLLAHLGGRDGKSCCSSSSFLALLINEID